MSTRCQVQVIGADSHKVTLYHHTDGYPTNMLPLFQRAFELSGKDWRATRGGKCTSFLCAADPGVFEPEAGHALHGDIEWYYQLHCEGAMHMGAMPEWFVTVYEVNDFGDRQRKRLVCTRKPLDQAVSEAEQIEKQGEQA